MDRLIYFGAKEVFKKEKSVERLISRSFPQKNERYPSGG